MSALLPTLRESTRMRGLAQSVTAKRNVFTSFAQCDPTVSMQPMQSCEGLRFTETYSSALARRVDELLETMTVTSSAPFAFRQEWHDALGAFLAQRSAAQIGAATRVAQVLGSLGELREPHIENADGQIRLTWNRGGHYIEVTVDGAGEVEWFHGRPDHSFEGDDGDGLSVAFRRAMEHARP